MEFFAFGIVAFGGVLGLLFLKNRLHPLEDDKALPPVVPRADDPRAPKVFPSPYQSGTQLLAKGLGVPGAQYIDRLDERVGQPIRDVTGGVEHFVNYTLFGAERTVTGPSVIQQKAAINYNQSRENLRRSQLNKAPGAYKTITSYKGATKTSRRAPRTQQK